MENYGYNQNFGFSVESTGSYYFNSVLTPGTYRVYLTTVTHTNTSFPLYINGQSDYIMLTANQWNTIEFQDIVKTFRIYIGTAHGTGNMSLRIYRVGDNDVTQDSQVINELFDEFGYNKTFEFTLSDSNRSISIDVDLLPNTEYDLMLETEVQKLVNKYGLYENYKNESITLDSSLINKVTFVDRIFLLRLYFSANWFANGDYRLRIRKNGTAKQNIPYVFRFPFNVESDVTDYHVIPISLKQDDKISIYLDTGFVMLSKVAYYIVDNNDTRQLLGTIEAIKPTVFTLPKDAKAISIRISGSNIPESAKYYLCIQKLSYDEGAVETHIYLNAADNNLYEIVEKYKDISSKYNKYYFHLNPGTYDLYAQFTEEEISGAYYNGQGGGFVGLTLYDGMYLIGEGSKDQIIITCEIPTTYELYARRQISTLNTKGNCGAKNITFISKNIRYTVHDDFGKSYYSKHIMENCAFIGSNVSNQDAYGAGMCGGLDVELNDCIFYPSVGFHTNSNRTAANIVFNRCKTDLIQLADNNSKCINSIRFNNCDVKYIIYTRNGTNEQFLNIEGINTNSMFVGYSDFIPKMGDVIKVYNTNLNVGNCVNYDTGLATGKADFYGVVIGTDNESVYIQHGGFIPLNIIGFTNVTIGNYLGITNSNLAIVNAFEDAIAIVCNHKVNASSQDIYFAKIL